MELRELGRTGLKLSSVGFGASPLGNVFGSVSEEQANASVRIAFQSGINFFDTSPYAISSLSFFLFILFFDFINSFSKFEDIMEEHCLRKCSERR